MIGTRPGTLIAIVAFFAISIYTPTDRPAKRLGAQEPPRNSAPNRIDAALPSPAHSGFGTEVPLNPQLTRLLVKGGIPDSLDQLRQLERQQQRVAATAVKATVSVQIGAAQGCGVIVTDTGYILTAAHVAMRPGKNAIVTLSDGRMYSAITLGMNKHVDAGLIRLNQTSDGGRPWPHATLGTSDNLVPGMWCIATGHPGGYDPARGPVTRVGRILMVKPHAIYTDCALIGGDSGGPLFDIAGRLIAVHSRIGNDVLDNLHVPVDHYDEAWDRMANSESWGYLEGFKPMLGVQGAPASSVAKIEIVRKGSPAEAAGFKPGDIVYQFGDVPITDFQSLVRAVSDTMPGEQVRVRVNRQGRDLRLRVEIGRNENS